MHRASVCVVIGTRPEALKLAPVLRAMRQKEIQVRLLLSGQHSLDGIREELPADVVTRLRWRPSGLPQRDAEQLSLILTPALATADLVVVQGDTSTAFAGALAARRCRIPLAHVEAGLRTHDSARPWPEEDFRVEIDSGADLLFAPTELSAANLRREGVRGEIHVTGNTAIDALTVRRSNARAVRGGPRIVVTCHRRESWGEGLERIASALRRIAAAGLADVELVLHPNPRIAAQMRRLLEVGNGIRLLPPCDHQAMLAAMAAADLVLSDSGGMQEEAPSLGVPLLVLRDATERPEGLVSNNLRLVGTDPDRIVRSVERLLARPERLAAMRAPANPYGDGTASERIADIICRSLSSRAGTGAERLQKIG